MLYGKQTTTARVDTVQPDSAAAAAGFKPGDLVLAIDGRDDRELLRHAAHRQHQRRRARSSSRSIAAARRSTLKATPALKEVKDNFGNVHRLGVLGISRSMAPGDIKTERSIRCTAVWLGAQETWFVIDRTLSYIGGVFAGRECGRPARRADPDRPGFRSGRDRSASRPCSIWPPCCRSRSGC